MKKLGLFFGTLLVSSALVAQILNQPANWPNPGWTLTGTFDPALANDPTTTANFGYDDDAAGFGSIDELVATSPVYDLNAAIAGGEAGLKLDFSFDFYSIGAELNLEYFDADANTWLPWQNLPSVSLNQGPDWCTTALPFQSFILDISSFSLTQASGFQYRFRYDDIFTALNWDWGYCINSVVLTSQVVTPPSAVDVTAPVCEDFEVVIPPTWTQYTTDQADWTRNTGGTFSPGTGPSAAANGTVWYLYTEASSPRVAGDQFIIESWSVDLGALTVPRMNFYFHMFGAGMDPDGTLEVEVTNDNGLSWTNIFSQTGNQGDVWNNGIVDLSAYAGDTVSFRFIGTIAPNTATVAFENDFAIDEICIEETPTCPTPTAMTFTGISGNSADIGWTDNAGASSWEIEYGAAGYTPGTGSSIVVSTNPYTLSSLTSSFDYDVYIRSICAPGDTSLPLQGSFSTLLACGDTATICYDENNTTFESFIVDNSGDWVEIEFISGTVENSFDVLVVTDSINGAGNTLYNLYGNLGDVSGLTFTSPTGELSFGVISDFLNSCQSGSETPIEYTISCFPAPTCFDALSANAYDIGQDSAFVAINDTNSTFLEYIIELGPSGFAPGSGTQLTSALDSVLLSGLAANTLYDVYITPICAVGDTAGALLFSFQTECSDLIPVTLPYIEDFEATTNITRNTDGDLHCDVDHRWIYETSGGEVNFGTNATGTIPTGLGAFTLDNGNSGALEVNYVILNLDLSAYAASNILELYFDYIENGDETNVEDRVWVRGSDADTWVEVYNWTVGPSNVVVNVGPLDIDAALSAAGQVPTSTFQVRFGQNDNFSWAAGDGVSFDNVIVTENTCPQPTNLAVSSPNTDALITWVNPAPLTQEFILEYGPAGFTPGTGTTVTVPAASTSTTITGLLPLTSYDVYIQTVCSAVDSSLVVGPVNFTTGVAELSCSSGGTAVLVFSDDLESNNGWTGDINAGNGSWEFPGTPTSTGTGPNAAHSGAPGSFVSYEATGNQSVIASFISPAIDLTTAFAPVRLSFYVHAFGGDIGTLNVDVSDDGGVTFTPTPYSLSGQQQTAGNDPWLYQEIDLSAYAGSTINVSFNYGGTGLGFEGDLALDLIQVETCVPCAPPATFTATVVDPNTIDLTWIDGPVATDSFFLEYGASGFVPGTGTILTVLSGTNNLTVSGLTGNTSYDFYITSVCTGPDTSFALSQTVITPCDVFAVPFIETFSGSSWGQTTLSNITFDPCWTANPLTTSAFSWRADQGTTGSGGTGPSGDHTTGLGTYLYTEATGASQGDFAEITTPLIALDDASLGYQLSFWYHMFGGDMGTLEVLVENGSGAVSIWSLSGQQQTVIDDPWIEVSLDLSAYAGDTITVTWRGTRGPGFTSDMAIDDIGITVLPPLDYIVSAFTSPATPGCYDPSALVTVEIVNGGSDTLITDSLGNTLNVVQLGPNGGSFNQTVILPSDTLLPFNGNSMALTLGPLDLSQVGTYDFIAFVNSTDINSFNDTLTYQVVVDPLAQLPIQEDFTGFTGANLNAIGPLSEWEGQGSPQNAGFSGWTDDLFANAGGVNGTSARINLFSVGEYAWVLTPIFEVESNTTFTYDIALTDFASTLSGTLGSDDTVAVYVSTDCGVTWNPVVVYDASSVISNTGQNDTVDLSAYVGQNIQVGFYATEGNVDDIEDNDIFIDNINIQTIPNVDAAFIEFLSPNDGCGSDSSEIIAVVANLGLDTLTSVVVDVLYGQGSAPQASVGAVTGVLAPGQFDTLSIGYINTLNGYSPLLLLGTVEVLSGQDGISANDTAFTVVALEAVPMAVAVPNASICLGDSVDVSLAPAMNGEQTMYYLSDTSTTAVAMGDTVTFSPAVTTTYYVQRGSSCYAVEEVATGGSLNSTLTSFSINGLPGNFPSGATIIFSGFGDIDGTGGNLEQWNVSDENGNLLGSIGGVAGTTQCGDTLYDTVAVSAAQMAAWNSDGVIQFSGVDAAGNINTTLCGGDFLSVRIEYCGAEPSTAYTVSGGCASDFSQFTIEVNNPTLDTVQVAICEGTSYALPGGNVVIQPGLYTDALSTVAGCDSVIVTDLTINPTFTDTLDIVLCDGDGYTLPNGVTVYDSGFYAVNLQTSAGCDSLLAFNVSIVTSFTIFQSPVICTGQSFVVGGTPNPSSIYTQTGAYVDTLLSSGGCDSVVYTNLSVLPEINIDYGNIGASICESDSVIDLNLLPIGGVLTGPGASGNLFDPNVAGLGSHNLTYSYTDTTTGCVTTANFEVDVVLCTGIENIDGLTQLAVFPVPFNDLLGLELEAETEGALTVSLYDAASQLVYRNEFSVVRGANTLTLEVGALQAAGVYMLELERDGKRHVIEILREE